MNTKTEKPKSFGTETEKTDLKNSQNRKTENPNVPLILDNLSNGMRVIYPCFFDYFKLIKKCRN